MAEQPLHLQQNLVTLLGYGEQGGIVAKLIDVQTLDPDYRMIAEAAISYWKQYNRPPQDHMADLLSHIIDDKGNRRAKAIQRILRGMMDLAEHGLNGEYVLKQVSTQQRLQMVKAATLETAELLNSQEHLALPEVMKLWEKVMQGRERFQFAPGLRIDNPQKVLSLLNQYTDEFNTGIAYLDKYHVTPARGEEFIWLGASGRGKSWAMVENGVAALRRRKKVLHLTLEMKEERTAQRYYQKFFAVTRRKTEVEEIKLTFERGGRKLSGFRFEPFVPRFSLDFRNAGVKLANAMSGYKGMYKNLVIKQFPPHELTVAELEAYLDYLEEAEGFVPDVLIVDYAGIMKVDPKNVRDSMAANVLGLRAVAVKRNIAVITAHQSNREGAKAKMITATHVAEAWPVVHHADCIVTFSSSDFEFRSGLCRGFVAKARNEEDKFAFLFTQNYKIGQFSIDSRGLVDSKHYFDILKELEDERGDGGINEVDNDDEDTEHRLAA